MATTTPNPTPQQLDEHGTIPAALNQRLHDQELDLTTMFLARALARELHGRSPLKYAEPLKARYLENGWDPAHVENALIALERAGYGRGKRKKRRRERGHGCRLQERHKGLLGKLPRALALRLPTTINNQATGRRDGRDPWGDVRCNRTLRDGVLGILAFFGGMWIRDSDGHAPYVEFTLGELAYVLRAARRATKWTSGKDLRWVLAQLIDLSLLEITATGGGEGHEIPSSPVLSIQRRHGEDWLTLEQYAERIEHGDSAPIRARDTFRVQLADWFIDELRHEKRRPVFIDFEVWRQLRPLGRRLYAMVQATHRSEHNPDQVYLWFAPVADDSGTPVKGASRAFTFGYTTKRLDKIAASIRGAIHELYAVDARVEGYGKQTTHGTTTFPAFTIRVTHGAQSRPRHPGRVGRAFDWAATVYAPEMAKMYRDAIREGRGVDGSPNGPSG
jgi:hypothetical protein